jgi:excisionase family DNA binding protein
MTSISNKKTKLISLREAARILDVNPETLRRWDNSGKLMAVRVGARKDRKYKFSDIVEILENK